MEDVSAKTVSKLVNGDPNAFKVIYSTYSSDIFKISKCILKNDSWAEEIVQETFLKLWLTKETIEEGKTLWPFIYVTAKHLCFNKLRSIKQDQKAMAELFIAAETFKNEDAYSLTEIKSILNKSVCKFTSQQKKIWKLSREEGYSHKQIAEELNISNNTVKNHLVSALKALRLDFINADYLSLKNRAG